MRITHINRLQESEFTGLFFKALEPLRAARRLGPVLFQLPPNFQADPAVLEAFLGTLPEDIRTTFEFRNASWLNDETYRLLERHRVALCLAESEKFEVPQVITAQFVYARLRKENYSAEDLREIAQRARQQLAEARDVFLFFKHEDTPDGALHAEELLAADLGTNLHTAGVRE